MPAISKRAPAKRRKIDLDAIVLNAYDARSKHADSVFPTNIDGAQKSMLLGLIRQTLELNDAGNLEAAGAIYERVVFVIELHREAEKAVPYVVAAMILGSRTTFREKLTDDIEQVRLGIVEQLGRGEAKVKGA